MDYVAKETIKTEFEKYGSTEDFNAVIDSIPPADVVPVKHGRWILVQEYDITEEDGEKYWECSLCGCGSDSYDTNYHTAFCPNCGARMEEEE